MPGSCRGDSRHRHRRVSAFIATIWRRTLSFKKKKAEDRFASYKGVRNVTIKKGSSSLGIMIIEGRHAEVGQGIFISDIQEGSAAEQAGLQIGDMILAVNKDSLLGCSYDTAAATLKRTEGVVVLTVCNPNKKDDTPTDETGGSIGGGSKGPSRPTSRNQTPDPGLKASGASRPTTPKPSASPARSMKVEPVQDPATAAIVPNKETYIEIHAHDKSLGLMLLGGSDTLLNGGAAVILEVYPNGVAAKDGRLKFGDQILECMGTPITKEMTHEKLCMTVKQLAPKVKLLVYRPDPIQYTEVEVELAKKAGKGLGLGLMARSPPPGVYIMDLIPGGSADVDGRLQKGDLIVSVDGKDIFTADHETAACELKTTGPKARIKIRRFKIVR